MHSLPILQSSRPASSMRAFSDVPTTALSGHDQMSSVACTVSGSVQVFEGSELDETRGAGRHGEVGQDEARYERHDGKASTATEDMLAARNS
jgi:hypothetical protein